jgi:hypothetical protein
MPGPAPIAQPSSLDGSQKSSPSDADFPAVSAPQSTSAADSALTQGAVKRRPVASAISELPTMAERFAPPDMPQAAVRTSTALKIGLGATAILVIGLGAWLAVTIPALDSTKNQLQAAEENHRKALDNAAAATRKNAEFAKQVEDLERSLAEAKLEAEKLKTEKAEREKAELERAEREKAEQDKAEREKTEKAGKPTVLAPTTPAMPATPVKP